MLGRDNDSISHDKQYVDGCYLKLYDRGTIVRREGSDIFIVGYDR